VRRIAREIAENAGGGVIDAETGRCPLGGTVTLIYKRSLKPARVYTGMLIVL